MLPEHERYELGQKIGDAIRLLVEVIAMVEHVQPWQVWDEVVERYVAERIINPEDDQ